MSNPSSSVLTITIDSNGFNIVNFIGYNISRRYQDPFGTFEFTLHKTDLGVDELTNIPYQFITIQIDNQHLMYGIIYKVVIQNDGLLKISGCERTQLLQWELNPSLHIPQDTILQKAILQCILPYGFGSVFDTEYFLKSVAGDEDITQIKIAKQRANDSSTCYSFINKIAAKYGFTIQSSKYSDGIRLAKPRFDAEVSYKLIAGDTQGANISDSSSSRDFQHVASVVQAVGVTGQPSAKYTSNIASYPLDKWKDFLTNDELYAIIAPRIFRDAAKSDIFLPKTADEMKERLPPGTFYSPVFIKDSECHSALELQKRIQREFVERLKPTLGYSCSVQGHKNSNGNMYELDTMAQVNDAVSEVNGEVLWVGEISYSYEASGGQKSHMTLFRKDTYLI